MSETTNDASPPNLDDVIPGSVLTHRNVRTLKLAIAIMTVLLVVGLIVLVAKMAMMASGSRERAEPATVRSAGQGADVAATLAAGGEVDPARTAAIRAHFAAHGSGDGSVFAEAPMAPGARVASSSIDGKTLVLTLSDAAGITVYRIDLEGWRVTGILRLAPGGGAARP